MTALPLPREGRWRPLRLGLVDLFYYDRQEFRFRDGRLMLRGNNGAGKSKVLALTLPFLLDGDTSAHKVEPDGDPTKRMDWNLLLGGKYDDRLGYSWMEFGRVDEEGREHFRTIGIGVKAVRGKGVADKWFFATTRRIGDGLELIAESGVALSQDRLEETIGTDGDVVDSASHYRRLVDEQLFHLGEDRYAALVDLLVQLRQPQLSKRPKAEKLSKALSDALAPVDQDVLADIAEAFHDQSVQRGALEGLKTTARAANRFGRRYAVYAKTAARRAAEGVRTSQSRFEKLGSTVKQLGEQIEQAVEARDRFETEVESYDDRIAETDARVRRLESRNELADLKAAQQLFAERDATRVREAARLEAADERSRNTAESAGEAAETAANAQQEAAGALETTASAAVEAALAAPHGRLVEAVSDLEVPAPSASVRAASAAASAAASNREEHAELLAGQCRIVEEHQRNATAAAKRLSELEQRSDGASDGVGDAEAALEAERERLAEAWNALRPNELGAIDIEAVGLREWTGHLEGPNPAAEAARSAYISTNRAIESLAAEQRSRSQAARARAAEFAAERTRIAEGQMRRPDAPSTRSADRAGRPGAPLWQLVDFHDHVNAADRAGYEAALEASGMLDAWVSPDGRLLDPGLLDDFLVAPEAEPRSTAAVLRPAIDAGDPQAAVVFPGVVSAVLAAIGLGEGRNWIAPDGRYRVGPRHGASRKTEAEYIGHAAREAARARRLDELETAIEAAESEAAQSEIALTKLDERRDALDRDLASVPADQDLRDAHRHLARANSELVRCRTEAALQQEKLTSIRSDLEAARVERDQLAEDLGLPAEPEALRRIERAISRYREAAVGLWAKLDAHRTAHGTASRLAGEAGTAARQFSEADTVHKDSARKAAVAKAGLDQLEASLGSTVAEINRDLQTARELLEQCGAERVAVAERHAEARDAAARLEGKLEQAQTEQSGIDEERRKAIEALRGFTSTGLLAIAVPDAEALDPDRPWVPDPAVHLARRIERELADVDADIDAWNAAQRDASRDYQVFTEAVSPHGHQPTAELVNECFVVTVGHNAKRLFPGELAAVLAEEVDYRERLLDAKERELLEEHLINDVAYHLQQLIDAADAQVRQINAELDERPTSTGMRLRIKWNIKRKEAPEGLKEVRRILLHEDTDMWSGDDQARVSAFLHRQIQAEAAQNPEGTWADHLANALDYRRWHQFDIERYQNGEWKDAIGPASGGERVLIVSLPLFAAASSHYRSAYEHAPRLIMLDEAFAGVDDDSRAKCLGLLAGFDLDVAMTSEREWGFYPTVPGIRTYQLVRTDDIDAVHVTVFEWDGRHRTRIEQPV